MRLACDSLRALSIGLALGTLVGCREEPPPELVKNSCLTDLNCPEDAICQSSTLMCVRKRTVEPYRVVLQVQPGSTSVELPNDAGTTSLVAQTAIELGFLEQEVDDASVEVPAAVRKVGRVQEMTDGGMKWLESELTLTPRMSEAQLRNTVVNSGQNTRGSDDAGVAFNVQADLDPSLTYDLRVQPLLSASTQLPPYHSAVPYEPGSPLDVEFGPMRQRSARLSSIDGKRWGGRRIRLEDNRTTRVMSSVVAIDGGLSGDVEAGVDGRFSLYAEPDVLRPGGLSGVQLVTDLSRSEADDEFHVFPRWQVTIAVAGANFLEDAVINMPNVPSIVTIEGDVLNADTGQPLANANLEFVSEFEVDETSASDSNWCRQPALAGLACRAHLSQQTDERGHFERQVVPGRYRVFVQPDRASSPDRGTFASRVTAENNTPGVKPQKMEVRAATQYNGTVRSLQGQGMPNVTVNGRALGVKETSDDFDDLEPELATYNRNLTAVTNSRGQFSIHPDIGRYDFTIETPAESGFAWMFCPNYVIVPRNPQDTRPIQLSPFEPPTPVILAGSVEHQGVKLPNARLEAYAVWGDEKSSRLLLVARGVSDAEGRFRLAMPPQLPPANPENPQEERCPVVLKPPKDAGTDAELDTLDSGLLTADGAVNALDSGR